MVLISISKVYKNSATPQQSFPGNPDLYFTPLEKVKASKKFNNYFISAKSRTKEGDFFFYTLERIVLFLSKTRSSFGNKTILSMVGMSEYLKLCL